MTQRLSAESPRRKAAREFGAELGTALVRRKVSKHGVARQCGVVRSALANYLTGSNLPRLDTARRLADLLDWPRLTELIVASRTYTCAVCPRTFVYDGMGPRRYCSATCQTVVDKMRLGRPVRAIAVRAERALALHATAVAAFCKTCEPDGQCKTRDCELRSVSPLPLVFA